MDVLKKKNEEKEEDLVDLTEHCDSVNMGVELTGNWEEDEAKLYQKDLEAEFEKPFEEKEEDNGDGK